MTRRPGSESDRLTLRGLYPLLKRALILRCLRQGKTQEKLVIEILERELAPEKVILEEIDLKLATV